MMDINRHNYQERAMEYIEDTLPDDIKKEFENFLRENKDIASEIASLKESVPVLLAGCEVFPYKDELRAIASDRRRGKVTLLRVAASLSGIAAAAAIAILAVSGLRQDAGEAASGKIATTIEVPAESESPAANETQAANKMEAANQKSDINQVPADSEVQAANKTQAINIAPKGNGSRAANRVPDTKKVSVVGGMHGNKAAAAIQNTEEEPFPAIIEGACELSAPVLSSRDFELPAPENPISLCDLKMSFYPEHNAAAEGIKNDNIREKLSGASRAAALILASIDSMLPIRKQETESETVYHIASIAIVRTSNK